MKTYKNYLKNMALRRSDPGIRQIRSGKESGRYPTRTLTLAPILTPADPAMIALIEEAGASYATEPTTPAPEDAEMDCTAGDVGMTPQEVMEKYPDVVPKAMFPEGETVTE